MRFSKLPPYSSLRGVAERRQEFVHEIAVRGVDFDDAKAGVIGALRRGHEGVAQLVDLVHGHARAGSHSFG